MSSQVIQIRLINVRCCSKSFRQIPVDPDQIRTNYLRIQVRSVTTWAQCLRIILLL